MKVLIATHHQQGGFPGDYCWCLDGELVTPVVVECCSPGVCGCGRGFPGLATDQATTTAMVADLDIAFGQLALAIRDSLTRGGWLRFLPDDDADDLVNEHISAIVGVASAYPTGTVLRREGRHVSPSTSAA